MRCVYYPALLTYTIGIVGLPWNLHQLLDYMCFSLSDCQFNVAYRTDSLALELRLLSDVHMHSTDAILILGTG